MRFVYGKSGRTSQQTPAGSLLHQQSGSLLFSPTVSEESEILKFTAETSRKAPIYANALLKNGNLRDLNGTKLVFEQLANAEGEADVHASQTTSFHPPVFKFVASAPSLRGHPVIPLRGPTTDAS